MLIHGNAGSGKSTTARKAEEYLWDVYDDKIREKDTKKQWIWIES